MASWKVENLVSQLVVLMDFRRVSKLVDERVDEMVGKTELRSVDSMV